MLLPEELQQAIEKEVEHHPFKEMMEARQELTERYRERIGKGRLMQTEAHRQSYLITRLPATYAAVTASLEEVKSRLPDPSSIKTLLDLGSGPGTAMWAACDVFPHLERATLIEQDADLMAMGKRLAANSPKGVIRAADWRLGNLQQISLSGQYDLITLSYSAGELSPETLSGLISQCWELGQLIVCIEPGTPQGFNCIHRIRQQLIALNGHMVAPCPHTVACPLAQKGDWCHFSVRVDRSFLHRRLKEGTLPYEDEKYSYMAMSKVSCHLPETRVLRPPLKRSGHVCLLLCTSQGLKETVVSKRTPELYRQAKKLEWGASYPPDI